MKKTIILIALVFFMINNGSYVTGSNGSELDITDELFFSVNFDNLTFDNVTVEGKEFTKIDMFDDSISYTLNPGEPKVPVKGCRIVIPYGHEVDSVNVLKKDRVSYSTDLELEPAQRVFPYGYDGEVVFEEPNMEVYGSDEFYPNSDYEVVRTQVFRGYTILVLRLYPVKYNPVSGQVDLYTDVEVSVETSFDSGSVSDNYRGLEKDLDEVKKRVDNPSFVDSISVSPDVSSFGSLDSYDLVVVTTESLKNYNGQYDFQALVDAKSQIGLNTKIMSLQEIYQNHNGMNPQERIRNFVKFAYNNWGTDYVLLAGDEDKVPIKQVYVKDATQQGDVPCDLYYACLDSPAPDGTSSCDLTAEVFVGRAPVDNTQEVSNFVKKTIGYMQTNDDYINNALWLGEVLRFGGDAEYGSNLIEQSIGHCADDGYITNGLPEKIWDDEGYTVERWYDTESNHGGNERAWTRDTLVDKINENSVHLINHIGHGNWPRSMRLYSCPSDENDVARLTNTNYFFFYSQGCSAGSFDKNHIFDGDPYECFAEEIIVNRDNGAFATILNSRYGFQYRHSTDGPNNRYSRQFWDALYGENKPILGQAFHDSKHDNFFKIDDTGMLWGYYTVVLIGDPSIMIKGTNQKMLFSPHSYDFGKVEKDKVVSTHFKIWNANNQYMSYSLSTNCDWVDIDPSNGYTSNGARETINVTIDTTGLSNGFYECDISIDTDFGSDVFKVNVKAGQDLKFYPQSYEKGCLEGEIVDFDFEIWNEGSDELIYSLSTENDWISFTPSEGSSTGEHDTVTAIVNTNDMEEGWHSGEIKINSNGGDDVFMVNVAVGSALALSHDGHDFGMMESGKTATTEFEIWSMDYTDIDYEITSEVDWLTVSPSSGSCNGVHEKITVDIDTQHLSDGCGYYNSPVVIITDNGNRVFDVSVDIVVKEEAFYGDSLYSFGYNELPWSSSTGTIYNGLYYGDSIPVGDRAFYNDYGSSHHLYRGFLFFDTSNIPKNKDINQAFLMIKGDNSKVKTPFNIILQNGQPEYPHNPLEDGDFNRVYYSGNGGSISTADINPFGYSNLVLNQEGINWVNKDGVTKLAIRTSRDIETPANSVDSFSTQTIHNVLCISDIDSDFSPKLVLKYGKVPDMPEIVNPTDDEENVDVDVELNVRVSDPDGNSMTVGFYDASNNRLIGVDRTVSNNDVASVVWHGLDYETSYEWYAVADDHSSTTQSATWSFTTRIKNDPPVCINENPFDSCNDVSTNLKELKIDIIDNDGDDFDWSITTSPDIGEAHGSNDYSGTKTCSISTLEYDTTYTWTVTVTTMANGDITTNKFNYEFTTLKHSVQLQLKIENFNQKQIKLQVKNTGQIVSNIKWNITIDSILSNKIHISSNGVLNTLETNTAKTVTSNEISGLNLIKIKTKVNVAEEVFTKEKIGILFGKLIIAL